MKSFIAMVVCLVFGAWGQLAYAGPQAPKDMAVFKQKKISLGKLIFHDQNLSEPAGRSCGSCHIQDKAFADSGKVLSHSADGKLFGPRNTPSIAYVQYNPVLHWDFEHKHWVGGFFYDGRETNIQSQAAIPFTSPFEMGNSSIKQVVEKLQKSPYVDMFKGIYGKDIFDDVDNAMYAITDAIVNYEMGPEFAKFDSKYDWFLQGKAQFSALEKLGLSVFEDKRKGNCASCHQSSKGENGKPAVFTNYTYANLGLAKPNLSSFYTISKQYNPKGKDFVDKGLAENANIHDSPNQLGKFKVPTLRNVAITAPYMHNGMFDDLRQAVEFHNTRDVDKKWGKAEVSVNVDQQHLGNLKLNAQEVDALVAFMKTLTDGYRPVN